MRVQKRWNGEWFHLGMSYGVAMDHAWKVATRKRGSLRLLNHFTLPQHTLIWFDQNCISTLRSKTSTSPRWCLECARGQPLHHWLHWLRYLMVPGSTSKSTSVLGNAGGGGCGDARVSDSMRKTFHGTKKDKMKARAMPPWHHAS